MIEISVLMLVHNREAFVSRAIESVLAQTFHNFEFIIVNNGSTDRSGEIAEAYAAKDMRIRVIHRACGNIGGGRNTGLDHACGQWITFIDDDDWCEADYLQFLYSLTQESGADIAICGATDKAFDKKVLMTAEEALLAMLQRKYYNVAFPAKLFRASLFDTARFSLAAKYDDIELMPKILGNSTQVAYHGMPKYTFYRHENNHSAWTTNHKLLDAATLDEYLSVYCKRTEWLIETFPARAAAWQYFEWSFMISMIEKITRLNLRNCLPQRESMVRELTTHRKAFFNNERTLDFEKAWIQKYIFMGENM